MEITKSPLDMCNFVRNLFKRVSEIHNEAVEHESSLPKCEVCSENANDFTYIRNQLFLIVKIYVQLKDEESSIEEKIENQMELSDIDHRKTVKEEEEDSPRDSLEFPTNFITLEDYAGSKDDNTERNPESREKESLERKEDNETDKLRLYQCAICNFNVSKKCNLVVHVRSHFRKQETLKSKKFRENKNSGKYRESDKKMCPLCKGKYKKKHECKFDGPRIRNTFSCSHCPETFSVYLKIYHHHKANHPDRPYPVSPFQCEICGAFSLRMYTLKRHMLSHTDYAPHSCDVCQKRFRTPQKLRQHKRKHIPKAERDDKFKCDVCHRRFNCSQTMKKHKFLKHTENRKFFPCSICGGKFISHTSLQKHLSTHDGKAPRAHKCEDCGRIFEKLKYFNQHRKKQHNIFTDLMLNPKPKKIK